MLKEKFLKAHGGPTPWCRLDMNPKLVQKPLPVAWERGLLLYAIYLWTDGNGRELMTYPLKRLKAVYRAKLEIYTKERGIRVYRWPSVQEIQSMGHQTDLPDISDPAIAILKGDISDMAMVNLIKAYDAWKEAKKSYDPWKF